MSWLLEVENFDIFHEMNTCWAVTQLVKVFNFLAFSCKPKTMIIERLLLYTIDGSSFDLNVNNLCLSMTECRKHCSKQIRPLLGIIIVSGRSKYSIF